MVWNVKSIISDYNCESIASFAITSNQAQYSCVYNKINVLSWILNLEI